MNTGCIGIIYVLVNNCSNMKLLRRLWMLLYIDARPILRLESI